MADINLSLGATETVSAATAKVAKGLDDVGKSAERAAKQVESAAAKEEAALRKMTLAHAEAIKMDQARTESLKAAAAASVTMRDTAKKGAETISKMASVTSMASSALGGMGGQAGSAAAAIVGAFGAGGPAALAIAGIGVAMTAVAGEAIRLSENLKTAKETLNEVQRLSIVTGEESTREAERTIKALSLKPGDIEAERAAAATEFARASTVRATKATEELTKATEDLAKARERAAEVRRAAASDPDRKGGNAELAEANRNVDRLTQLVATTAAEAESAKKAADESNKAAAKWGEASVAVRAKAKETESTKVNTKAQRLATVDLLRDERAILALNKEREDLAARNLRASQAAESRRALRDDFALFGSTNEGSAETIAANDAWRKQKKALDQQVLEYRAKMEIVKSDTKDLADEQGDIFVSGLAGTINGFTEAGTQAAEGFAGAFAEASKLNMGGMLKNLLGGLAGVLSVIPGAQPFGLLAGAGSGLMSALGFRDGGAVRGYEIPKARGGAMVIGNTDPDGRLIEAHSNEVVLTADAVQRNGGMAAVAAQNEPGARPLGGASAGNTTINVVALDPLTAVNVIARSVEPAQVQRMQSKQGAKWRREISRAARGPNNGMGR